MNNDKESKSQPSHGLLRNQITTRPRYDNEGNLRVEIVPIEHELSFDKGLFMFIRAVQVLRSSHEGIMVVGLAGPSGAGKTVFSSKVRAFLPGTAHIQMDMYNDGTKVVDENFDDPRLTDYDTLLENISGLRRGEAVQTPVYDFRQSKRVGFVTVEPPASRVVVVEGIYALSSKLRDLLDLRVSIKGGVHFDLVKRVLRDIDRSGQQPEAILQQISSTVYPMYKIHIEPDLLTAHLKVVNHFNPFSGLQNATYTLKSDKSVSEEEVCSLLATQAQGEVKRSVQETTDIYLLPPNEDPETCQTWLRVRSRDGKYSLMFEEFVTDGPFIISPRITFEVSVRVMGGLMALGYQMKIVMQRHSVVLAVDNLTIKIDRIAGMEQQYVQIQGKLRDAVAEAGHGLGLDGTYTPHSYIEQVQLQNLTSEFKEATRDLRSRLSGSLGMQEGVDLNELIPPQALLPDSGSMSRKSLVQMEHQAPSRHGTASPSGGSQNGEMERGGLKERTESNVSALCAASNHTYGLEPSTNNSWGNSVDGLAAEVRRALAQQQRLTEQMDNLITTLSASNAKSAFSQPYQENFVASDLPQSRLGCFVAGVSMTVAVTSAVISIMVLRRSL